MTYGKVLGALAAVSLGFFALSPRANATMSHSTAAAKAANSPVQLAEESERLEDKAKGKVNEGENMATGAGEAVENAHERHEAREGMHHGLKSKAKAKMHEGEDMTSGAANAVEREHRAHEAQEGESH